MREYYTGKLLKSYLPYITFFVYSFSKGPFTSSVSLNAATTLRCRKQFCSHCAVMLLILFSLKTMVSLENEYQLHSEETPLFSMRTVSLASSQSCGSVGSDVWCKRALKTKFWLSIIQINIFRDFLHGYKYHHRLLVLMMVIEIYFAIYFPL